MQKKVALSLFLLLVMASALFGCSKDPAGGLIDGITEENFPDIDGSLANLPYLAELYSRVCGVSVKTAESRMNVSEGTGAVWNRLLYGEAEILVVYEAPESVKAEIEQMGLDLEITPIGRDGLVFLVNKENPIDDLSVQQLKDIYTGDITNWQDVGGGDMPISAFQRNRESGSQTLFLKLLMEDAEPMIPPMERLVGTMGGLILNIAAYDNEGQSLGFSVYYYADLMYDNPNIKMLSVNGVTPSNESIGAGSYPLVNDFYVVIRADEPEGSPARMLRDFIISGEGKKILEDTGYVVVE